MSKKMDLRVIKTMKNIRESFISLLEFKRFNDITVQNILDTALINRTTFYKYYKDKHDLAEQLAAEFLNLSKEYLNQRFCDIADDNLISIVKRIYAHLLTQKVFVLGLWTIETETVHVRKDFEMLLKDYCKLYLLKNNVEMMADYHSSLYSSIVVTTIEWLFSHEDATVDEVVQKLKKILLPIFYHTYP